MAKLLYAGAPDAALQGLQNIAKRLWCRYSYHTHLNGWEIKLQFIPCCLSVRNDA